MIWIESYYRIRNGCLEHVRGHWRRLPGQDASRNVVPFPSVA